MLPNRQIRSFCRLYHLIDQSRSVDTTLMRERFCLAAALSAADPAKVDRKNFVVFC